MTSDDQLRQRLLDKIRAMPESMAKERVPGLPNFMPGKHGLVPGVRGMTYRELGNWVLNRKRGYRQLLRRLEVLGWIT
jgi:hypothetical protein